MKELKAGSDLLLIQSFVGLVVSEDIHKLLLQNLSVVYKVVWLVLIFDLVHNDLFNYILKGDNTYHLFDWIVKSTGRTILNNLGDNTKMGVTFLEVTEEWL